jgi:hypothetical protein
LLAKFEAFQPLIATKGKQLTAESFVYLSIFHYLIVHTFVIYSLIVINTIRFFDTVTEKKQQPGQAACL